MRACLNLNESGPLKVSAERAGTLSSAANGVLMIQRSLMLTGAHPRAPLTHTRPPNHPHRHMKKHSTAHGQIIQLDRQINQCDTGIDKALVCRGTCVSAVHYGEVIW